MESNRKAVHDLSKYDLGWTDNIDYSVKPEKGLNEAVINLISDIKKEPAWMREFRLSSLKKFRYKQANMPLWLVPYIDLDFEDIYYYLKPASEISNKWEDVPEKIKNTYEKLGIPEAERKFLAGVTAQIDSETVYHRNQEHLEKQGILFTDMDTAIRDYPDIVKKYFAKVIPPNDNLMAALNSAVMSGGSFIYVPPGIKVEQPLQAYFRINNENAGQFERTLIVADEGSEVTYFEGCVTEKANITLPDGSRTSIKELEKGNFVRAHTGEPTKIVATMSRKYAGKLYAVKPDGSQTPIETTEEHPFLVLQNLEQTEPEWIKAKDLQVGNYLIYPKPKFIESSKVLTKNVMWIAGKHLLYGNLHQNSQQKKSVNFRIEKENIETINKLTEISCEEYNTKPLIHSVDIHYVNIIIESEHLYNFLIDNVMIHDNRGLSSLIMSQPKDNLIIFLESIHCVLETDMFTNSNLLFLEQIRDMYARLGLWSSIKENKIFYAVNASESEDFFVVPIVDIVTSNYEGYVYNIETESESYCVEQFATHNCSASVYSTDTLHSAVVELVALPHSTINYMTIQNWSDNVYNLVTKRGVAYENASIRWTDINSGAAKTLKYPAVYLAGKKAKGEVISAAWAGQGQNQDTGAKMVHMASETSSLVDARSITANGGRSSYRGLVKIENGLDGCRSSVSCDALIMDEISRSDTYPYMEVSSKDSLVEHEATVSKINEQQLFYLRSRGLTEKQAQAAIVNGFLQPIHKHFPMEYSVEFTRLIELNLEEAVG